MPNMKYLSLTVQKLRPRLKFFATVTDRHNHRQTGQKLDAPELHKKCEVISINDK